MPINAVKPVSNTPMIAGGVMVGVSPLALLFASPDRSFVDYEAAER